MSYVVRILPPEEWPRLVGTEAETAWPHFNPINTRVVVVERDGVIVGTWTGLRMVHAECLWIDPAHRHSAGVSRRLLMGLHRIARDWNVDGVLTSSISEKVARLIAKAGGSELPGPLYVLPMSEREGTPCQQPFR